MPQPAPLSDTLITDTASKGGRGKADDADLGSRSRLSVTSMLRSRAAWPMRWTRPSSPTPSGQRPHSPPLTSTRKWSGEGSGRRSWSRRWIGSGCSRIDDHPGLRASDALISACSWRPGQADQGGRTWWLSTTPRRPWPPWPQVEPRQTAQSGLGDLAEEVAVSRPVSVPSVGREANSGSPHTGRINRMPVRYSHVILRSTRGFRGLWRRFLSDAPGWLGLWETNQQCRRCRRSG